MAVTCVYWIRCADHTDLMTQGYIGVSSRFETRMEEHFRKRENRHLNFAIEKYGWENLIKEQILIAEEDYCFEIEQKLRPTDKIGWNLIMGGGRPPLATGNKYKEGIASWNKGISHSIETVGKISKSVSNLWKDPKYRQHMSFAAKGRTCPMKGKKHRPESIEKMRLSKIGIPSKKKGRLLSEEQKANLSQLARQNPWECPHCQKIGYNIGAGNRWHFDNCKLNLPTVFTASAVDFERTASCQ